MNAHARHIKKLAVRQVADSVWEMTAKQRKAVVHKVHEIITCEDESFWLAHQNYDFSKFTKGRLLCL